MVSRMPILFCILIILTSQSNAQPSFRYSGCVDGSGNYTANSTYQNNLNILLSNLSSNTQIDYGFYNFTYGQDNDRVNAIGLCRGDVKPDACRSCLNNSRVLLPQLCPNQKAAIGGYDECMLRYSNRSMEIYPTFWLWNPGNATDVDKFNEVLDNLLSSLISNASSGNSLRKFDAASAKGPAFQTIYGLVQCTPDLSGQDCNTCLIGAKTEIPKCCDHKQGGRVVKPSCNVRYEITPFYDTANVATPQAPAEPPPTESAPRPSSTDASSTEGNSNTSRTVIVIVVPIIAFVILVILICIYLRKKKPRKHYEVEAENGDEIRPTETLQLNFTTIMAATDNFSDARKLGQGGFGFVYKEVAVKRLSMNFIQGDIEFKNEVLLVAKLQHRNIVRLLGLCLEGRERLLVYEFVPNKSLDFFIFDQIKRANYIGKGDTKS